MPPQRAVGVVAILGTISLILFTQTSDDAEAEFVVAANTTVEAAGSPTRLQRYLLCAVVFQHCHHRAHHCSRLVSRTALEERDANAPTLAKACDAFFTTRNNTIQKYRKVLNVSGLGGGRCKVPRGRARPGNARGGLCRPDDEHGKVLGAVERGALGQAGVPSLLPLLRGLHGPQAVRAHVLFSAQLHVRPGDSAVPFRQRTANGGHGYLLLRGSSCARI